MSINRRELISLAALGLGMAMGQHAMAQEWPARQPLRIIVPYPAGGNADSAARAMPLAMASSKLFLLLALTSMIFATVIVIS